QPAHLVDLAVRREGARLDLHRPPAHHLGAPTVVGVVDAAEVGAEGADEAGLLGDLAAGGGLEALARFELALGERPVVAVGAVAHQHLDPAAGGPPHHATGGPYPPVGPGAHRGARL